MIRQLLCRACALFNVKGHLKIEDRRMGWQERTCWVSLRNPPLICDLCGDPLEDFAMARTSWRGSPNDKPRDWECEFGEIVPPETIKLTDKLTGKIIP
jgi:hypothetical protein